jgi:trafficking protein particle complex subunit 10
LLSSLLQRSLCTNIFVQDEDTFSIPITLVALHHGELSLPRASVTPLPVAGGDSTMASTILPGCETYQEHGAEKVLVLPRGGRSTFLIGMGGNI